MRKFFAITTAVLLNIFSANAQYKMKVIQDDGRVSEFLVSKIKEVIWEELDEPITPEPEPETREWVDLGLPSGTKWATCNVGAFSPEGFGDYFAWGETEPKSTYDWSTYKWCDGSIRTMTKYCTQSKYGTVDNKTVLDPEDDVAHVKLGGNWRMPTDAEWKELMDNCVWTWTTQDDINGYKITSKSNGNYIFLPASGYREGSSFFDVGTSGYYWSASLRKSSTKSAWHVYFFPVDIYGYDGDRSYGLSVRPVCP